MTTSETTSDTDVTADDFAERILASALGAFEMLSIYVGDRLGWYRRAWPQQSGHGSRARRRDVHPRAVCARVARAAGRLRILVTDPGDEPDRRRYAFTPGAS